MRLLTAGSLVRVQLGEPEKITSHRIGDLCVLPVCLERLSQRVRETGLGAVLDMILEASMPWRNEGSTCRKMGDLIASI